MAGIVAAGDDPRALAALIRDMQRRIARLETQNRLKDATLDAPGALQFKDLDGNVRFRIGLDDMGGVGYSGYDASGILRLRIGQNAAGNVVYEGFEPDGSVRFRLGEDPNGGIGYRDFTSDGTPLAAAEQAGNNDPQTVTSTTYVDAGPTMSISTSAGPSGQLLVVMSALMRPVDMTVSSSLLMSFETTGGRVTQPLDVNSLQASISAAAVVTGAAGSQADHTHGQAGEVAAGGEADHTHAIAALTPVGHRASRVVLLPDCDPKVPVALTARYRVTSGAGWTVDDRSLIAIPL